VIFVRASGAPAAVASNFSKERIDSRLRVYSCRERGAALSELEEKMVEDAVHDVERWSTAVMSAVCWVLTARKDWLESRLDDLVHSAGMTADAPGAVAAKTGTNCQQGKYKKKKNKLPLVLSPQVGMVYARLYDRRSVWAARS